MVQKWRAAGDPCGPLFFALTIQPVLQSLQDNHLSVRVVAHLVEIVLQGPATALAPAYQFLRDRLSTVGLVVQPQESWLFSQDAEAAASLAASLGIPHSAEGMVVAGIEPQERHLKDLRFGDDGYGMRGDVLVLSLIHI